MTQKVMGESVLEKVPYLFAIASNPDRTITHIEDADPEFIGILAIHSNAVGWFVCVVIIIDVAIVVTSTGIAGEKVDTYMETRTDTYFCCCAAITVSIVSCKKAENFIPEMEHVIVFVHDPKIFIPDSKGVGGLGGLAGAVVCP